MFEHLSHFGLQQYWWVIISLLASFLVFLMFVQGGQTLIYTIGKNDMERKMIINALGRKWEFTFTTLVTFGGAFFASFPLFYSTSFGGAFWVWMIILFCFVIQAVAYEFRSKPGNILKQRTYDLFLFINGALGTILIGTAVGTFFTGAVFSRNIYNFARWETPWRGLEAAFNIQNLALGLAIFFLARTLAILYFMNTIDDRNIFHKGKKQLLYNAIPFVVLFLFFTIRLMFINGYAYDPDTMVVFATPHKYFTNFIEMPWVLILFLAGVILVLYGILLSIFRDSTKGIWFTGSGTILAVFSLFIIAGLNNTCYYPSTFDLQSSLNIINSSSSKYTLTVMSYVSLIVPFVLAYIFWAWKSVNNRKIDEQEMNEGTHTY
jgi:cytochrome d ubiquinol oxidase subunit II